MDNEEDTAINNGQTRNGELDMDEMQMAIAALSSMKGGATASATSSSGRPSEITLPPISTFVNGNGNAHASSSSSNTGHHNHNHHQHHGGGVQYSYVSAANQGSRSADGQYGGGGPTSSSASTSNYTYSPVTTPSVRTTTSLSSPGTPDRYDDRSPYFNGINGLSDDHSSAYDLPEGRQLVRASSSSAQHEQQLQQQGDDGFIGRVSQFPLVSGALRVYERGRNSSRVVKYGTDLMETSVKTISKPVINHVVGPNLVGQIDDFACRQLDRFGTRASSSPRPTPEGRGRSGSLDALEGEDYLTYRDYEDERANGQRRHGKGRALLDREAEDASMNGLPDGTSYEDEEDRCSTPKSSSFPLNQLQAQQRQTELARANRAGRSRWQSLVIEAGVTAGGIGAAVSEESMKSLKYCLHWLHYATAHLDHQVGILREFILSLSSQHRSSALMRGEDARAASILDGIKRDVVETIRKVVDVVSTYAGAALPEQARRYVRSSILGLPEQWARAMQGQHHQAVEGGPNGAEPHLNGSSDHAEAATSGATIDTAVSATHTAAERTLTFAVESLDMLRGVLGIFNDSVERADAWVERLRLVGLQRQHSYTGPEALPPVAQVSDIRSSQPSSTTNGVRKRDEDGSEAFRRRKNSRKLPSANGESEHNEDMEVDSATL